MGGIKLWPRDKLWIGRPWFRLQALKSSILRGALSAGIDVKIIVSLAMRCPVVGPDSVDSKKHQQKIDDLLSQELATKFEAKLHES
jgi:hypothetical protein